MKATGIVRRVDDLGRVVVPKEMRRTLGVSEGDPLEFFVDGECIMLKKYSPGCTFCGSLEISTSIGNKHVCGPCVAQLQAKEGEHGSQNA